jgi:hypothetical protein
VSDVRIFRMGGSPSRAGSGGNVTASSSRPDEIDAVAAPDVDKRLLRLEHVEGDGVWAKRRRLGEGNRLGLVRGNYGSGGGYVIQVREPIAPTQPVHVRDRSREDVEQEQTVRSWADEIELADEAELAPQTQGVTVRPR